MTDPPGSPRLPAQFPRSRFRVLYVGGEPAIVDVHDGDSVRLVLISDEVSGVGFWPWLRLDGCDAPELADPGGLEARQWVIDKLSSAKSISVELAGWSFDRRVAKIWIDGYDLTVLIIGAGHAVPWKRTR